MMMQNFRSYRLKNNDVIHVFDVAKLNEIWSGNDDRDIFIAVDDNVEHPFWYEKNGEPFGQKISITEKAKAELLNVSVVECIGLIPDSILKKVESKQKETEEYFERLRKWTSR